MHLKNLRMHDMKVTIKKFNNHLFQIVYLPKIKKGLETNIGCNYY